MSLTGRNMIVIYCVLGFISIVTPAAINNTGLVVDKIDDIPSALLNLPDTEDLSSLYDNRDSDRYMPLGAAGLLYLEPQLALFLTIIVINQAMAMIQ